MPDKRKLTTCTLETLMEEVRADPALANEFADALAERGFRSVVEENFELSEHQRRELDEAMTEEFSAICRDACIMALRHDGNIIYVQEGHTPPNMRANVYCKYSGAVECGVRFEC
jgi:hypothetical protein